MESVPFLSVSLDTQGWFTACWFVLVVQRAGQALPPRQEQREARLWGTEEAKEKGFAWQMNAADMPVLAGIAELLSGSQATGRQSAQPPNYAAFVWASSSTPQHLCLRTALGLK